MPSSSAPKPVQKNQDSQPYSKNEILVKNTVFDGFVERKREGITLDTLNAVVRRYQLEWGVYLSVAEMHSLADQLTRRYRRAGFNFTRVVVPPQEITNNTLTFRVIEAVIGDVHIRGADWYSDHQLHAALTPLKNKVVTNQQVKQVLDRVNRFPGLNVFGYFSKGAKPNTTRLNIKVQNESIFDATLKIDNYGSESTGLYRALGLVNVNNPLGFADQLQIGVLQTLDIDNQAQEENRFGSLSYRVPFHKGGASFGLSVSNNQFELGQDFSVLGVQGEADIYRIDLTLPVYGVQSSKADWTLFVDQKETTIDSELSTNVLDENETSQGLGIGYSYQILSAHGSEDHIRWGYGSYIGGYAGNSKIQFGSDSGLAEQREDFAKLVLSQSFYWDYQSKGIVKSRLLFEMKGQYSDQLLPDIETFSLSGPNGLKSFESGLFNADKGGLVRLQWYWLARFIKPFVFYESAYGERRSTASNEDTMLRIQASGYGLGFDSYIAFGDLSNNGVHCRFAVGQSDNIRVNREEILPNVADVEDRLTVYGELSYRFP